MVPLIPTTTVQFREFGKHIEPFLFVSTQNAKRKKKTKILFGQRKGKKNQNWAKYQKCKQIQE